MAVFICLYILGEFHSYIQYFLTISTFTPFWLLTPQIFLLLFPSLYFLYNPWSSVGGALVCTDVGLSTSHIPEERTSSPSPGSCQQSEALSSSPLTPRCWLAQSCSGIMQTADSECLSSGSLSCPGDSISQLSPISGSDPCLLIQCFLGLVDREDRDVPRGVLGPQGFFFCMSIVCMCRGCAGHTCGGHRPTLGVSPHFYLVTKTVAFGIKINDSQGLGMELRGWVLL